MNIKHLSKHRHENLTTNGRHSAAESISQTNTQTIENQKFSSVASPVASPAASPKSSQQKDTSLRSNNSIQRIRPVPTTQKTTTTQQSIDYAQRIRNLNKNSSMENGRHLYGDRSHLYHSYLRTRAWHTTTTWATPKTTRLTTTALATTVTDHDDEYHVINKINNNYLDKVTKEPLADSTTKRTASSGVKMHIIHGADPEIVTSSRNLESDRPKLSDNQNSERHAGVDMPNKNHIVVKVLPEISHHTTNNVPSNSRNNKDLPRDSKADNTIQHTVNTVPINRETSFNQQTENLTDKTNPVDMPHDIAEELKTNSHFEMSQENEHRLDTNISTTQHPITPIAIKKTSAPNENVHESFEISTSSTVVTEAPETQPEIIYAPAPDSVVQNSTSVDHQISTLRGLTKDESHLQRDDSTAWHRVVPDPRNFQTNTEVKDKNNSVNSFIPPHRDPTQLKEMSSAKLTTQPAPPGKQYPNTHLVLQPFLIEPNQEELNEANNFGIHEQKPYDTQTHSQHANEQEGTNKIEIHLSTNPENHNIIFNEDVPADSPVDFEGQDNVPFVELNGASFTPSEKEEERNSQSNLLPKGMPTLIETFEPYDVMTEEVYVDTPKIKKRKPWQLPIVKNDSTQIAPKTALSWILPLFIIYFYRYFWVL